MSSEKRKENIIATIISTGGVSSSNHFEGTPKQINVNGDVDNSSVLKSFGNTGIDIIKIRKTEKK